MEFPTDFYPMYRGWSIQSFGVAHVGSVWLPAAGFASLVAPNARRHITAEGTARSLTGRATSAFAYQSEHTQTPF